jgi:hypothetical protein
MSETEILVNSEGKRLGWVAQHTTNKEIEHQIWARLAIAQARTYLWMVGRTD